MKHPQDKQYVRPLQQGKHDRLCGIYSVVNAILWIDPDSRHLSQRLVDCGLAFLFAKQRLDRVMLSGMTRKLWLKLAHHILAERNRLMPSQLALQSISRAGGEDGSTNWSHVSDYTDIGLPVLANVQGAYNHFTVITDVTEKRVILFDSDGLHWLQRRTCVIGGPDACRRFWIEPPGLVTLQPTADMEADSELERTITLET